MTTDQRPTTNLAETHNLRLFALMITTQRSQLLSGIVFTLLGAVLFSGKAVLAKLVYREAEISVVSVLALRMLFSLPFYLLMFAAGFSSFKMKLAEEDQSHRAARIRHSVWQSVIVGMLGYYVSSYLDFSGLKFISAGLERIILFTYPTFTLLFAALFFKSRISGYQVAALLVSYAGVVVAFAGDIQAGHSENLSLGALLVFGCAITYATYVLLSGRLIPYLGASFFTSVAMMSATAGVLLHFIISGTGLAAIDHLSAKIYWLCFLMAVFTTVLPSYLLAAGLKRIGSSNVAIISSIGPMATILQAYWFLGESFGWLQWLGTVLVVTGVLIIGRKVKDGK